MQARRQSVTCFPRYHKSRFNIFAALLGCVSLTLVCTMKGWETSNSFDSQCSRKLERTDFSHVLPMSYMQANKAASASSIVSVVSHTDECDLKLCPRSRARVSYFWITMLCSKLLQASFPDVFTGVKFRTLERKSWLLCWVILYVWECHWYYNWFPSGKKGDKYFKLPNYRSCFILYTLQV